MPTSIRRNSYYNDPAVGKAFDDLARAFAPPKATDIYASAHAASERQKADRLSQMFAYASDPNYNRETADRLGVMGGLFNPNQSYYSVDQTNTTSRANNDSTNRTSIEKTKMDNDAALTRQFALPIHVNENQTVRLPDQTAAATGLPSLFGGQTSVNQGETIRPADGSGPIVGQAKPLNESEWKAAQADELRKKGAIDDPTMAAIVMGNTPLEVVQTPEGPRNMTRPQAIGQAPVLDETKAPKPQVSNYKLPDMQGKPGMAGTAILKDGAWFDSQTGEKLPPGAVTYSAALTGDKSSTGLGPTQTNITTSNKLDAALTSAEMLADSYTKLLQDNPGIVGVPGMVRGAAQNLGALLGETTAAFGDLSPDAKLSVDQVRGLTQKISPNYDPNIQKARMMTAEMAYSWAQLNNPAGEVSRQAYERALELLSGGMLHNNSSGLAGVEGFRDFINRKREEVNRTRNPQPVGGATPTGTPAAAAPPQTGVQVEKWTRGPDGKLMRAQ